jgi:hypothetical protein
LALIRSFLIDSACRGLPKTAACEKKFSARTDAFCNRAHEKVLRIARKYFARVHASECHVRAKYPYFSDIFSMSMVATLRRTYARKFFRARSRDNDRVRRRAVIHTRAYTLR